MIGDKSFIENVNYIAGLDSKFGSRIELLADNITIVAVNTYTISIKLTYYSMLTLEYSTITINKTNVTNQNFDSVVLEAVAELDITKFTTHATSEWNTAVVLPQKKINISVDSINSSTIWLYDLQFSLMLGENEVLSISGTTASPKSLIPKISSIDESSFIAVTNFSDVVSLIGTDNIIKIANTNIPSIQTILDIKNNIDATKVEIDSVSSSIKSLSADIETVPYGTASSVSYDTINNNLHFAIAAGQQGPKGDTGPQGIQGEQGVAGLKGDTGDVGPQGMQGIKGDTGDIGPVGPQGPKGDTGATGAQGIQGPSGPKGANGASVTSVSSVKVGNVTTVTVSGDFVGAPYSFDVLDGFGSGDMMKSIYDPSGSGKVVAAVTADSVEWNGVANKPSAYPPLAHSHNEYVLVSTLGTMADFTAALG